MLEQIAQLILENALGFILVFVVGLKINHQKFAEFLGFNPKQIDVCFDPQTSKFLVLYTRPTREGQRPIWSFPQSRASDDWIQDSYLIADKIGILRSGYKPESKLRYLGKSKMSRKSYRGVLVVVSESICALKWESVGDEYIINDSVSYSKARFVSKEEALQLVTVNSNGNTARLRAYCKLLDTVAK